MKTKVIEFRSIAYSQEKNTIRNAVLQTQKIVNQYNDIEALPDLTEKDWESFKGHPQTFFENQVEVLKHKKFGNDPIDVEQFKSLYQIPDLNLSYIPSAEYLDLKNGKVEINQQKIDELKQSFTITTADPELIKKLEAIENIVKEYDKLFFKLFGNANQDRKHDFAELGYNRRTGQFDNNTVIRYV